LLSIEQNHALCRLNETRRLQQQVVGDHAADFVCALLVAGIVSDEIKIGIKNSRAGNYNMRLNGHIILLNWNNTSTALLRHIASAYAVSILKLRNKYAVIIFSFSML